MKSYENEPSFFTIEPMATKDYQEIIKEVIKRGYIPGVAVIEDNRICIINNRGGYINSDGDILMSMNSLCKVSIGNPIYYQSFYIRKYDKWNDILNNGKLYQSHEHKDIQNYVFKPIVKKTRGELMEEAKRRFPIGCTVQFHKMNQTYKVDRIVWVFEEFIATPDAYPLYDHGRWAKVIQ
uniref:Uncharacterized protein n=1 Tax=viral metagenome TaxID=1070528 RepID=A0A6M3JIL7_9ZZZZ